MCSVYSVIVCHELKKQEGFLLGLVTAPATRAVGGGGGPAWPVMGRGGPSQDTAPLHSWEHQDTHRALPCASPFWPLPGCEFGSSSPQPSDVGALSLCFTEGTVSKLGQDSLLGLLAPAPGPSAVVICRLNTEGQQSLSKPEGLRFKSQVSGFGIWLRWGLGSLQAG